MDPDPTAPDAGAPLVERRHGTPIRLSTRSILLLLGTVVLALAARNVVGRSLGVVGWTVRCAVVAALVHPLVRVLARRLPKGLAVLLTLVAIVALVGGLGYTVVGDVRSEQARLSHVLPEAAHRLEASHRFGRAATDFRLAERVDDLLDALPRRVAGGTGSVAVRRTATRGATLLVNVVLTIFLVVYGPKLVSGGFGQIGDAERRRRARAVAGRAYRRAWNYVAGRIVLGVLAGLVSYVVCRIVDLPGPTVLALAVGVASVVPYVGVIVGGLPIVLLAFGLHPTGFAGSGVLLALVAYQTVETVVFLRPLHRRSIVFGPALSVLVVMVGFSLGGLGLALSGLAVAVFAVCMADELAPDVSGAPARPAGW